MPNICCLSDLHGYLPEVPDCDLLLLAGDYCPSSKALDMVQFMGGPFFNWLKSLQDRFPVIGIAGNHDMIFEWPVYKQIEDIPWTYLQDSGTTWNGLKIWGTPWQPRFWDWAFNLDEDELVKKWALIPDDTDVLLVHGPPQGIGDWVPRDKVHTGSPGLLKRILEIEPKLVVCGHIHPGYGRYQLGPTTIINAALVNEAYQPVNPPQTVTIEV